MLHITDREANCFITNDAPTNIALNNYLKLLHLVNLVQLNLSNNY